MNQGVIWSRIQISLQVRVVHRLIPGLHVPAYLLQCLMRRASRPEPVGTILEIRLEDRLQDQQGGHLHHSVSHCRYTQGSQFPVRLGDVDAPYRLRPVGPAAQRFLEILQKSLHPARPRFDRFDRHAIHAGRPLVGSHPFPGRLQRVPPIDPVVQSIEPELRLLLGFLAQLLSQTRECLRQRPLSPRFRRDLGPRRLSRSGRFLQAALLSSYRIVFLLRPLRSTVITRFLATMGRSDSRPGPHLRLFIPPGHWSRQARPPRRASQVPRLICPRALSPTTPEGPAAALALCFTTSIRLHPRGRTGHLQEPLTRPNRVHLRYGSRVRFARLRRTDYSVSRSLGYLPNGQLQGKLLSAYKISQAFPGTPLKGRDTNHRPVRTRGRPVFPPLQG